MSTVLFILLQTVVEFIALIIWFQLDGLLGQGVLIAGLIIENIIAFRLITGKSVPIGKILLISASESAIWFGWKFILIQFGFADALLGIFVTMVLQHNIERNIAIGRKLSFNSLFNPIVIPHTIVEAFVCTYWGSVILEDPLSIQGLIGALILLVGLEIEHVLSANLPGREGI